MNDQSQHITHYSAADIQRYLSGNMSAPEMHAMEKAALDDPFLADAIEGMDQAMQSHGEAPVNQQLQELTTAIAEKIRPASGKVRGMVWWKISAAAVIVIAAGIFLWNSYLSPDGKPTASKNVAALQKQEKAQEPVLLLTDSAQPATVATDEGLPSTFSTTEANKAIAEKEKQAEKNALAKAEQLRDEDARLLNRQYKAESNASQRAGYDAVAIQPKPNAKQIPLDTNEPATIVPDGFEKKDIVLRSETNPPQFNFSDTVGRPVRTEIVGALQGHTPGLIAQSNADNRRLNNVIRGRVTDNAQRPIPNANLNAIGQQQGMNATYFTDREGFFNIPVRNIDTGALNVSVAAIGFNTQQFKLSQSPLATNNLQLEPANQALNEVVVVGYGRNKSILSKKFKEPDIHQQNAEPVNGWAGFENYLRENNRLSKDSARAVRNVVVSFVVNRKGELSDFTITSGSTTEANAEALRLIKEGPAWKIKRGRKATATVIVHF